VTKKRMNLWGKPSERAIQYANERKERIDKFRSNSSPGTPESLPADPPKTQSEPTPLPQPPPEEPIQLERVERFRIPSHKKRRHALSVSVSIEEEELLRAAANKAGMTFSGWVRHTLFKAMGRKPPRRPK